MRVNGHFDYKAPPERVYAAFTDPGHLLGATPGLVELAEVAPDRYRARLRVGVGGYYLYYDGVLTVTDRHPPASYRLHVEATTENGFGRGDGLFTFAPRPGGGTRVTYDCDLELGGAQKLLPPLARMLAEYFVRGMAVELEEELKAPWEGRPDV